MSLIECQQADAMAVGFQSRQPHLTGQRFRRGEYDWRGPFLDCCKSNDTTPARHSWAVRPTLRITQGLRQRDSAMQTAAIHIKADRLYAIALISGCIVAIGLRE